MSRTGGSFLLRLLVAEAVVFITIVSLPWVVLAVYPGSLRPTAAVLCPDDKPDPLVVQYSEETSEGTGTSWTLFCLDEDGEVLEVGSWAPLGVYFAGWFIALQALALPLVALSTGRARRRARTRRPRFDPPPFSPPGPQGPYG